MEGGAEYDPEELSAESVRSAMAACDLDVVMALRTLEAVEKDAQSVAFSLSSLLSSLQSALSKVTSSSVKHLECYNEVAGHVQEAALDAAMKGNRFINACLRLNEEMKGMSGLAAQVYPCFGCTELRSSRKVLPSCVHLGTDFVFELRQKRHYLSMQLSLIVSTGSY